MPLYEFQCQACGHVEEFISPVVVRENTMAVCICGGGMIRLFPKARINLHGSGKSAIAIIGRQKPKDDQGEIFQYLKGVERHYAEMA